jgi:hypothetical protein
MFRNVIWAFGITAPELSVTAPKTVPFTSASAELEKTPQGISTIAQVVNEDLNHCVMCAMSLPEIHKSIIVNAIIVNNEFLI